MKKHLLILLLFSYSISFTNCKFEQESIKELTIVNFNQLPSEIISQVKNVLNDNFLIDTILIENQNLPEEAFYQPRNRYRADKLIRYLRDNFDSEKVIGLTYKDISITSGEHEDWGIMGLAFRPEKSCVVSTFRTFRGVKNERQKAERLSKVVLHEFGHTLNLPHCDQSTICLMRDANGKVSTVDEVKEYCQT